MMKLSELVRLSERIRRINARFVKITGYKTGFDANNVPTAVCRTRTPLEYTIGHKVVKAKDQKPYTSSIKFLDKKLNVKVSCSCPDFMYRWEYADAQVGAADIIYGNGEPSDSTNPDHRPGMCKHLLKLRSHIKEKHGF